MLNQTTVFWITCGIVSVVFIALIGWDVYLSYQGNHITISESITAFSKDHIIVPALFGLSLGILIGHFWW